MSTNRWMIQRCGTYIQWHTVYSAMKRHEVGSFVVRWMDGTGVWHTEWSKSEREKQTSYINAYIKNLKKLTNDFWYCFKEWLRVNLKREKFEFSMLATFHSTKEPPASAWTVRYYQHFGLLLLWWCPLVRDDQGSICSGRKFAFIPVRAPSLHGELWGHLSEGGLKGLITGFRLEASDFGESSRKLGFILGQTPQEAEVTLIGWKSL